MTIDSTNFHKNTIGRFTIVETPKGTPDYISKTTWGEISSIYYYTNEGVIRLSNHWGNVASCQWNLEGVNSLGFDKCRKVVETAGYISFDELNRVKSLQIKMWDLRSLGNHEEADKMEFNKQF